MVKCEKCGTMYKVACHVCYPEKKKWITKDEILERLKDRRTEREQSNAMGDWANCLRLSGSISELQSLEACFGIGG